MTPAEHYAEAERLLGIAPEFGEPLDEIEFRDRRALIHATLATSVRPVVVNLGNAEMTPEFMDRLAKALRGEFE